MDNGHEALVLDTEKGLRNCMGNKDFYRKILEMYLRDSCFARAEEAYEKGDIKELFLRMHEFKGVSGNVALNELYTQTVVMVELLRPGSCDKSELTVRFTALQAAYKRSREAITSYLAAE